MCGTDDAGENGVARRQDSGGECRLIGNSRLTYSPTDRGASSERQAGMPELPAAVDAVHAHCAERQAGAQAKAASWRLAPFSIPRSARLRQRLRRGKQSAIHRAGPISRTKSTLLLAVDSPARGCVGRLTTSRQACSAMGHMPSW